MVVFYFNNYSVRTVEVSLLQMGSFTQCLNYEASLLQNGKFHYSKMECFLLQIGSFTTPNETGNCTTPENIDILALLSISQYGILLRQLIRFDIVCSNVKVKKNQVIFKIFRKKDIIANSI